MKVSFFLTFKCNHSGMAGSVTAKLLVVTDDPVCVCAVETGLSDGWSVVVAAPGDDPVDCIRSTRPTLVLIDVDTLRISSDAFVAGVRRVGALGEYVPIAAIVGRAPWSRTDGRLVKPISRAALVGLVTIWTPVHPDPVPGLSAVFGDALVPIVAHLRSQLAESIRVAAGQGELAMFAHRLAGAAGTLGFTEVYHTWLQVADGCGTIENAKIASRKAIMMIDRGTPR